MVEDEVGWTLPSLNVEGRIWTPHVRDVVPLLQERLERPVTVLRCLYNEERSEAEQVDIIYELEDHNGARRNLSEAGTWIGRTNLADLSLAQPSHKAVIRSYLAEIEEGSVPLLRPPWARRGWLADANTWMRQELVEQDHNLLASIEQVKTWGISCILRAHTDRGDIYFKVASKLPLFADEPVLTATLAARYPGHIPAPLAVESERGWMLLADFGQALRGNTQANVWEETLHLLGKLQLSSTLAVDALLAAGCLDRRLERLATQVEPLLNDNDALSYLDAEESQQLRRLGPRLQAMCKELANYKVPPALVHGDFHPGNVAVQEGSYLFFDWTDACIAHPFFDLVTMKEEASELPDAQEAWSRMRDAYLGLWTKYEPIERLQEVWELAEPLGMLHQVISYQHIVSSLEPSSKRELSGGLVYWTRELLKALRRP